MPSAPTHVVAVGALGAWFYRYRVPWHLWVVAATLAVIPDLDVIGFRFGIAYEDVLGHRGLSHSLPLAAFVSGFAVAPPKDRWPVRATSHILPGQTQSGRSWLSGGAAGVVALCGGRR